MPFFAYIGGEEFDETEMPSMVKIFGHRFVINQPVEVTDAHAVSKLRTHKFFEEIEDATAPQIIAPRKRGRPAKPVFAEDAIEVTDADDGDN
jgi:hypothetical protein